MRKVLNGNPSVELRRRVEELLEALAEWSPEELRSLRALEALEHMDNPDAEKLLRDLAKGSPDARLTREGRSHPLEPGPTPLSAWQHHCTSLQG